MQAKTPGGRRNPGYTDGESAREVNIDEETDPRDRVDGRGRCSSVRLSVSSLGRSKRQQHRTGTTTEAGVETGEQPNSGNPCTAGNRRGEDDAE